MNLLISRLLPDAVMDRARAEFDVTLRETSDPMTEAEVTEALETYDLILPTLGDQFTAAAISAATPRTKLLANFGVGFNHIDVDAAKVQGVEVTNTPGAVTDATADIAMTLVLMTARRAGEGERMVRSGKWTGWQPTQMLGLHLTGKTVGIIGMGRIGQAIANRCRNGFGCKIVYANRSRKDVDGAEQLDSMEAVAQVADVVVAATPGGPATRHLIGKSVFEAMQPHAIFVNISRGDVVNEAALITALQAGALGGAGLDVYENEPKVPDELLAMENVVLLPHLGTNTLEVRTGMGMMALDNLLAFAAGKDLPNPV
ncbi:lactate dehydrogenase-like 2-hydroxyacid dehydrogenase [Litoreibacter halocynthiae]|uniref:Lactate dehydrogenase-like 2-hydroxyacid dehydrogenase n=1 Tax=Litoreibacter halocynthiae TaxID=1242689 RepID=A0A4R7LLM6_9RHOB|nr:D-glycerate dehydrogenase [Litoreibacter halocynthiae]TDT76848.1 lactate dehydrogenase-like 2-hydroxyacid dehydrogenase [Litoreibacter halocynthiae]